GSGGADQAEYPPFRQKTAHLAETRSGCDLAVSRQVFGNPRDRVPQFIKGSGLCNRTAEGHWDRWGAFLYFYFAVHGLVFLNIVIQRPQQALGMLRSEDNSRFHLCFGHPGHYPDKIK